MNVGIVRVVEARNIAHDVLFQFHIKLTAKPIDLAKAVCYLWKTAVNSPSTCSSPAEFAREEGGVKTIESCRRLRNF